MKKILAILLLLCLTLNLFACSNNKTNEEETTDSAVDENVVVFKKKHVRQFKMVYPKGIGIEAKESIDQLKDRMSEKYGIDFIAVSDMIDNSNSIQKEWEHEILIGKTNREESATFGANYGPYDYGYGYLDGKIVIYSPTESYLSFAIEAFYTDVLLNNQNADVFYQSNWAKMNVFEIAVKKLTLNGVDVSGYEIIIPEEATLFEAKLAQHVQCYVMEQTCINLPVKTDAEERETANAILIGKTKFSTDLTATALSGMEGCINTNGTDIAVYADTVTGLANATKKLTDLIFADAKEEHAVTISGETKVSVVEDVYSAMTFNINVENEGMGRLSRGECVIDNILRFLPDTIGLQEALPKWVELVQTELADYYEVVGEGSNGGNSGLANVILYAKERFTLVESSTKWFSDTPELPSQLEGTENAKNLTWVILEDKVTGERYMHINTKLDAPSADNTFALEEARILVRLLQKYNHIPAIMTGDWSADINSDAVKYLQSYAMKSVYGYSELSSTILNQTMSEFALVTEGSMKITDHVYDLSTYGGRHSANHPAAYYEFALQIPANRVIDNTWNRAENEGNPADWADISVDQNGRNYGVPFKLSAFDLGKYGRYEIPADKNAVQILDKTYVVIRTVEELNAALAADTAHTNNYILAADLDYTGKTFTPITADDTIFDGNGYSIYGYSLENSGTFAIVDKNSKLTVRNLFVGKEDAKIQVSDTRKHTNWETDKIGCGTVLGYAIGTNVIENVTVYADVASNIVHAGGFVGKADGTLTLKNSEFYGSVTTLEPASNVATAGLVAITLSTLDLTVDHCTNYGTIDGGDQNAGGFFGYIRNRENNVKVITNSINYGKIMSDGYAGGLAGQISASAKSGKNPITQFKNCINFGQIIADNAGGLIGSTQVTKGGESKVENCANLGLVSGTGFTSNVASWIVKAEKSDKLIIDGCASFEPMGREVFVELEKSEAPTVTNSVSTASAESVATDSEITIQKLSMEEAQAWMKTNLSATFGDFNMNTKGSTFVQAMPTFAGIQLGENGSVRFIGTLSDSLRYKNLGFEITPVGGTATKKETTELYRDLYCATDRLSAESFGRDLVYAVAFDNFAPAQGTATYAVKAYATAPDGITVYSDVTYQVTFTDGAIASVTLG